MKNRHRERYPRAKGTRRRWSKDKTFGLNESGNAYSAQAIPYLVVQDRGRASCLAATYTSSRKPASGLPLPPPIQGPAPQPPAAGRGLSRRARLDVGQEAGVLELLVGVALDAGLALGGDLLLDLLELRLGGLLARLVRVRVRVSLVRARVRS